MKITIEIECDPQLSDVKTHLSVVRDQILRRLKNDDFTPTGCTPITFSDSNCYGSHEVEIEIK